MHADSFYWKYGGILFWTNFWFKIFLTFKAPMPLLANLTFRNGRLLVSVGSPTLTTLNSLFREISKIIPWSRRPGDPTSLKCKVKVYSYKACSRFNGIEYSFVRIWWKPYCKLTNGKSQSNDTLKISSFIRLFKFLKLYNVVPLFIYNNNKIDWHHISHNQFNFNG